MKTRNKKGGFNLSTITINQKWCKTCGICIAFCPRHVFKMNENGYPYPARQEDCIGYRLCELRCPDFAVKVEEG